jgi:DnaJ family protein C protein 13
MSFILLFKGLFSENKEKVIVGACVTLRDFDDSNVPAEIVEQQFHALRRLVASKAGFQAFTTLPK